MACSSHLSWTTVILCICITAAVVMDRHDISVAESSTEHQAKPHKALLERPKKEKDDDHHGRETLENSMSSKVSRKRDVEAPKAPAELETIDEPPTVLDATDEASPAKHHRISRRRRHASKELDEGHKRAEARLEGHKKSDDNRDHYLSEALHEGPMKHDRKVKQKGKHDMSVALHKKTKGRHHIPDAIHEGHESANAKGKHHLSKSLHKGHGKAKAKGKHHLSKALHKGHRKAKWHPSRRLSKKHGSGKLHDHQVLLKKHEDEGLESEYDESETEAELENGKHEDEVLENEYDESDKEAREATQKMRAVVESAKKLIEKDKEHQDLLVNGESDSHADQPAMTPHKEYPPLLMVSHGCSGTTGAFYILRKLLTSVSTEVAEIGAGELLRNVNATTDEISLSKALWGTLKDVQPKMVKAKTFKERLEILYERVARDNQAFVSKLQLDLALDQPDAMKYLFQDIHARPFVFRRKNLLDSLACRIHDFCNKADVKKMGHNVDRNGKEVSCEFRGRSASSREESASIYADIHNLLDSLLSIENEIIKHRDYLKTEQGLDDVKMFDDEDLFAFEYDRKDMDISAQKWMEVLSTLGFRTSIDKVSEVLATFDNFPSPSVHANVFYNFDEIKDKLSGTQFEGFIRE